MNSATISFHHLFVLIFFHPMRCMMKQSHFHTICYLIILIVWKKKLSRVIKCLILLILFFPVIFPQFCSFFYSFLNQFKDNNSLFLSLTTIIIIILFLISKKWNVKIKKKIIKVMIQATFFFVVLVMIVSPLLIQTFELL